MSAGVGAVRDRTRAASVWSRGEGIIAGRAAAALHGAAWIDDQVPIGGIDEVQTLADRCRCSPGLHTALAFEQQGCQPRPGQVRLR